MTAAEAKAYKEQVENDMAHIRDLVFRLDVNCLSREEVHRLTTLLLKYKRKED